MTAKNASYTPGGYTPGITVMRAPDLPPIINLSDLVQISSRSPPFSWISLSSWADCKILDDGSDNNRPYRLPCSSRWVRCWPTSWILTTYTDTTGLDDFLQTQSFLFPPIKQCNTIGHATENGEKRKVGNSFLPISQYKECFLMYRCSLNHTQTKTGLFTRILEDISISGGHLLFTKGKGCIMGRVLIPSIHMRFLF